MPRDPESYRPSHELNRVFTPVIKSYVEKVSNRGLRDVLTEPQLARTNNAKNRIGELAGKYPRIFSTASDTMGIDFNGRLPLVAPVGAYREDWARTLVRSARTLVHGAQSPESHTHIIHEGLRLSSEHENLLGVYTFNKTDSVMTVAEGFQSALYTAGILTMYKVPGYENDPSRLLLDLAKMRLFSKLALSIPPGLTGILGFRGGVFTDPTVVVGSSGLLSINPQIIEHFSKERDKEYKDESTFARAKLDSSGCPLARKLPGNTASGVDMAANLLAQTVKAQINQNVS